MGCKGRGRWSPVIFLVIWPMLLTVLAACSDNSSNAVAVTVDDSTGPAGRVYVSSPGSDGRVVVVSSENFLAGPGTVVGSNLSQEDSDEQDCSQDSSQALEDGSFSGLSLCAGVGDSIGISLLSEAGGLQQLGEYTVPATTRETCGTGERAFTISNDSARELWLGVTAGTLSCQTDADCPTAAPGSCMGANPGASKAGSCGCAASTDCGAVAQCNSNNKFCYWNPPALSIGQMKLEPANGQSLLCFPAPESSADIQWSGNMFARTGCNASGQQCETGDCGSEANKNCPTGTGGNPPNTLLEFTLSNQLLEPLPGPDFYDISIINGINVAASFVPVAGTFNADSSDPYTCAGPGSTTQEGSLSPCTWQVNPLVGDVDYSSLLRNVKPTTIANAGSCPDGSSPNALGNCECSSDTDCSAAGQLCGLALNAKQDQQYTKVCGSHLGWWTADQICGSSINNKSPFEPYGAPLNCAETVANSDGSNSTNTNFHICTQPAGAPGPEQAQSCYNNAAVTDCCGCATSAAAEFQYWPTVLSPSFGGADNGCYSSNPKWVEIAQPWLVFLKQACPTAYTYPFDDATSTFTCAGTPGSVGPPGYKVTFFDTQ